MGGVGMFNSYMNYCFLMIYQIDGEALYEQFDTNNRWKQRHDTVSWYLATDVSKQTCSCQSYCLKSWTKN